MPKLHCSCCPCLVPLSSSFFLSPSPLSFSQLPKADCRWRKGPKGTPVVQWNNKSRNFLSNSNELELTVFKAMYSMFRNAYSFRQHLLNLALSARFADFLSKSDRSPLPSPPLPSLSLFARGGKGREGEMGSGRRRRRKALNFFFVAPRLPLYFAHCCQVRFSLGNGESSCCCREVKLY